VRVFISSTCYDLIDVRAEVAEQLRQIGVTLVLSDDKLSDFKVKPDCNSIETCLVNVESCDEFILILDKRYGPSLKSCGYEDISATHLEFKRALVKKIPFRAYVRDRLNADYSIWKQNGKNSNLKYLWVKDKNDHRLFNFLEEYSKLEANSENNNFFDTFTNSIDLKAAITKHFEKRILPKRVVEAIQKNEFPLLDIKFETIKLESGVYRIAANLINVSRVPAFNFDLYWEEKRQSDIQEIFSPGRSISMTEIWESESFPNIEKFIIAEYKSAMGVSIRDRFCISALYRNGAAAVRAYLVNRKFRRTSEVSIEIEDE
jgi:hypothetical protein